MGDQIVFELAQHGWVVEVILIESGRTDSRLFAVAATTTLEAESLVLRFPGLLVSDNRIARRPLSIDDISNLKLRPGGVRSYIHASI
jgi:hypothetical protein